MILVESRLVAQRNSGFCGNSLDASVEKVNYTLDCMPYGLNSRLLAITATDGHILRYCVPMDNQRPQLDLKFVNNICPDQNGVSLRIFVIVFNTSL